MAVGADPYCWYEGRLDTDGDDAMGNAAARRDSRALAGVFDSVPPALLLLVLLPGGGSAAPIVAAASAAGACA